MAGPQQMEEIMTIRLGQVLKGTTLALALSAATTVLLPDEASARFGMGRGMSMGGGMASMGRGMSMGGGMASMGRGMSMGGGMLSMGRGMSASRMGMHGFAGRGIHGGGMVQRSSAAFGHGRAMSFRSGLTAQRSGLRSASTERLARHPRRLAHTAHQNKTGAHMMRDKLARPHHMKVAYRSDDRASRKLHHYEPPLRILNEMPALPFNGQNTIPIQDVPRTQPAQQATPDTRAPAQPAITQTVQSTSTLERTVMENGQVVAREWYDPTTGHTVERRRYGADGKVVEQEFFDHADGHRTQVRKFDPETGRHRTTEYFDAGGRKTVRVTFDRTGSPDRIDSYDPATGRMTSTLVLDPRTGRVVETGVPDPNNPGGQWKWVQAPNPVVQP
jgi:hypothetical protein